MKIGAKIAHLGMIPGMMMSSSRITTIIAISSGRAPMPALSRNSASTIASTLGRLLKLK